MEKKARILIVDDDIDIINVMETILEHEGYEVIHAGNKEEALEKAREIKPDLAILDVMMTTHYEGFELAGELRKVDGLYKLPVLMQTSIEVLTSTNQSIQAMAHTFRADPKFNQLQVLLIKDLVTGESGIDYKADDGRSVWVDVDGFIPKPVDSGKLLPQIERLLKTRKVFA